MAKRKKRGRKMPAWRKWAKAAVGILGKAVGITVAASPAIRAVQIQSGNPALIPAQIAIEYTGYDPNTGTYHGWQATARGIGTVVVGIGLMKLFSYLSRSV